MRSLKYPLKFAPPVIVCYILQQICVTTNNLTRENNIVIWSFLYAIRDVSTIK